jgi:diadenosine tetraphosphate (Ap4A) HIT family hydrolase
VRRIEKPEALALLEREREALPARFEGCAMCGLAGRHPADVAVLAEGRHAVVVLDRYATRRGHVLVVLRRHAEAVADLAWDEYADVQRLAWEASRALTRVLSPKRVFVAALGSPVRLPMSFPHHHVHVIPLFDGGEEDRPAAVLTWTRGVFVYDPDEVSELAASLRGAWERAE